MAALGLCSRCDRHARVGAACPFCGADVAEVREHRAMGRTSRAALLALVAVAPAALADCSRGSVTMYGGPPTPLPTVSATATTDDAQPPSPSPSASTSASTSTSTSAATDPRAFRTRRAQTPFPRGSPRPCTACRHRRPPLVVVRVPAVDRITERSSAARTETVHRGELSRELSNACSC